METDDPGFWSRPGLKPASPPRFHAAADGASARSSDDNYTHLKRPQHWWYRVSDWRRREPANGVHRPPKAFDVYTPKIPDIHPANPYSSAGTTDGPIN